MSERAASDGPAPHDSATVTVLVDADVDTCFRVFTEEIDQWWRRGLKYRVGRGRSVVHLEPRVGGALFESFDTPSGNSKVVRTGTVLVWDPPIRLVLEWRAVNFADDERTEVEVRFDPRASKTSVTVVHRGFAKIRDDHPARHGQSPAVFIRAMGAWWGELVTALRLFVLERE